ncbi:hypothetical protein CRG98_012436 [Punica granatum]|uniref:Uncharacterized protein n=1 Tax=Punica granatum TaxID=22663 RepID=A0A2I0KFC4_PUNGR|nr:hypothetical protein CRG98_012436 [Punica granatum]
MGIPSEMRDYWVNRRDSFVIPAPTEEQRTLNARNCTQEGVRAGVKAAAVTAVVIAVPTLAAVPSIAAYFITADKTILACARRNAQNERAA